MGRQSGNGFRSADGESRRAIAAGSGRGASVVRAFRADDSCSDPSKREHERACCCTSGRARRCARRRSTNHRADARSVVASPHRWGGSRGSHRAQSKLARRGATHGARRARRTKTLEDAAWREAPRCGLIGIRCRNVKGPCLTPPSAHTVACALPVRCPYVPCALCVRASRAARACPGALPGTRVPRFVRDACGPIRASHFGIACRYTGRAESVKERRGRSANPNSVKERSGGECWWS